MVYTVTLNPSIDYYVKIKQFQVGEINRSSDEELQPGGKGINVSLLLSRLGVETTALGFKAGFVGEQMEELLSREKVKTSFISCEGNSRINVKIDGDPDTQINGEGPLITEAHLNKLYKKIEKIGPEDILVLAGSASKSLGTGVYKEIISHLKHEDTKLVVDAAGELLGEVLEEKPFLVKPNIEELSELFDVEIHNDEETLKYAKKLVDMGARNVIVSLGVNGALMITEEGETYRCRSPRGEIINAVGAGDSLVAGFLTSYTRYNNMKRAFYFALRCGSATACSRGIASAEEIRDKYKAVIFDLDGTILNTIEDLADAVNYTMERYNQPTFSVEQIQSFVGNGNVNLMKKAVPNGDENPLFGQQYDMFYKYYMEHLDVKSRPYEGIIELLTNIKELGIPMAVVSNKIEDGVKKLVEEFFPDLFTAALGDNMVRAKKPAKDSVNAALNILGSEYNNTNTLYVGDSGVDSLTAECAGMDCILVSWGFRSKEELVNYTNMIIVDSPEEILYFLK